MDGGGVPPSRTSSTDNQHTLTLEMEPHKNQNKYISGKKLKLQKKLSIDSPRITIFTHTYTGVGPGPPQS